MLLSEKCLNVCAHTMKAHVSQMTFQLDFQTNAHMSIDSLDHYELAVSENVLKKSGTSGHFQDVLKTTFGTFSGHFRDIVKGVKFF